VRPVLKPVAQASDMEGEDTAMWIELRVASRACVLCDVLTAHPRPVSTLDSCTIPHILCLSSSLTQAKGHYNWIVGDDKNNNWQYCQREQD
jgi:hypothetical protein